MRPIGYLAGVAATAFGLALGAVALTLWVDPYRMYATPVVPGWTELKPRIYQETGIAKTYQLDRVRPHTLLLGNSRVEIGLDPESRYWPPDAQPVFNAAEDGTGLPTALEMLRESIAVRIPDTVVLGLDFLDFLQRPTPANANLFPNGPDARRLLVDGDGKPNPDRALQIWRDRLAATLTISAVYDSIATLFDQNPATSVTMTPMGFNPLHQYQVYVSRDGYFELFAQKQAIDDAQYRKYPAPNFTHPFELSSFRYLRQIIDLAAKNKIRLAMYIPPYHGDYLEMLHQVGLWPAFENWKRAVVQIVDGENLKLSTNFVLYDFAGYDHFTTEPVPPRGDTRSTMHWYWESAHYKKTLGDQVLATIFGKSQGFGSQLTTLNIEHRLAAIRDARNRFLATGQRGVAEASPLPARDR